MPLEALQLLENPEAKAKAKKLAGAFMRELWNIAPEEFGIYKENQITP